MGESRGSGEMTPRKDGNIASSKVRHDDVDEEEEETTHDRKPSLKSSTHPQPELSDKINNLGTDEKRERQSPPLEWNSAVRHAFLELCGAVMVRNLSCGLADTFCEIWLEDKVIYRSGIVRESLNPTWTLRARVRSTSWPVHAAQVLSNPPEKLFAPKAVFELRVIQQCSSLHSFPSLSMDPFPYHHSRSTAQNQQGQVGDGISAAASVEHVILNRFFRLCDLRPTGVMTGDMAKLGADQAANKVFLGLHHEELPLEKHEANDVDAFAMLLLKPQSHRRRISDGGVNLFVWDLGDSTAAEASNESDSKEGTSTVADDDVGKRVLEQVVKEDDRQKLIELTRRVTSGITRARQAETLSMELLKQRVERARIDKQRKREASRSAGLKAEIQRFDRQNQVVNRRIQEVKERIRKHAMDLENAQRQFHDWLTGPSYTERDTSTVTWFRKEADLLESALAEFRKQTCLIRAHRVNLLRALSAIYPLQERFSESSKWEYYIRGIPLSSTALESPSFNSNQEEQMATALGYLAHLVSLLAKYLGVNLRFVPLAKSSSSTICDPLQVCSETPHEPMRPQQSVHGGTFSSPFPQHIFGTASGRLGRSVACRALSIGTYPLHWKGLPKSLRHQYVHAVELLSRDIELLVFSHSLSSDFPRSEFRRISASHHAAAQFDADVHAAHVINRIRRVLASFM